VVLNVMDDGEVNVYFIERNVVIVDDEGNDFMTDEVEEKVKFFCNTKTF